MEADWRCWTSGELALLEPVKNFHELADVAIGVLSRMRKHADTLANKPPIVQICGPMSTGGLGRLEHNMAFFHHALKIALGRGLVVFNQIPCQTAIIRIANWQPDKPYCQEILDIFYRKVFESRRVWETLFLPDWGTSHGASWERKLITSLGISVKEFPIEWLAAEEFILPSATA